MKKILSIFCLCALVSANSPGQQQVIQTTGFTRNALRATNGPDFISKVGFGSTTTLVAMTNIADGEISNGTVHVNFATNSLNSTNAINATNALTLIGSMTNASQLPLTNFTSLTNGFFPVHSQVIANQMQVPIAMVTTFFDHNPSFSGGVYVNGTGPTAANIAADETTMVNNNFVAAGWDTHEIDEGWEKAGVSSTRSSGTVLQENPTSFPSGMAATVTTAHNNGLKIMLYTFYSMTPCGGIAGSLLGSPPGFLVQDFQRMRDTWGVDYASLDECGMPDKGEQAMKSMYWEMDNAVQNVQGEHNSFTVQSPFPVRVADGFSGFNGTFGYVTKPWVAVEGNIPFTADEFTGYPLQSDLQNWLQAWSNNLIYFKPGFMYNMSDIGNGIAATDTNSIVNQMTGAAVMPYQLVLSTLTHSAWYPFLTNAEVIKIYKDTGWHPSALVSNVASAGPIFVRPLGANGNVFAVVFANTNLVSSEAFSLPASFFNGTASYDVRDPWNKTTTLAAGGNLAATVATNSVRLFVVTNALTANLVNFAGGGLFTDGGGNVGMTNNLNVNGVSYFNATVNIGPSGYLHLNQSGFSTAGAAHMNNFTGPQAGGWTNNTLQNYRVFNLTWTSGTTYFSNLTSGVSCTLTGTGPRDFILSTNEAIVNTTGSFTGKFGEE